MKTLMLIASLLTMSCAHETTTMDRELALKLADQRMVASTQPVIININNGPVPRGTNCREQQTWDMNGQPKAIETHCFGGE